MHPLSKDTIALNAGGLPTQAKGAALGLSTPGGSKGPSTTSAKRIKQSGREPTKLEMEWLTVLRSRWPGANIYSQAITFKLANGVRYTPDNVAVIPSPIMLQQNAWEIKGKHAWDDSIVKLKMAAHIYPDTRWILVWKSPAGHWQEQLILP